MIYLSETTIGYLRQFTSNIKGEYIFPSRYSDALEGIFDGVILKTD